VFTGLIEEVGRVRSVERANDGATLFVEARAVLEGARIGDSMAVDGCCLTITALAADGFTASAVPETLRRTTLGGWSAGRRVNLERPVTPQQRMGGHFVQGHVDGVARVEAVSPEGDGRRVRIVLPERLARFVAEKGSLAVDGVSLTVAGCVGSAVEIAYIPHTLDVTVAGEYASGREVNVEVDLVARYVARLLEPSGGIGEGT